MQMKVSNGKYPLKFSNLDLATAETTSIQYTVEYFPFDIVKLDSMMIYSIAKSIIPKVFILKLSSKSIFRVIGLTNRIMTLSMLLIRLYDIVKYMWYSTLSSINILTGLP